MGMHRDVSRSLSTRPPALVAPGLLVLSLLAIAACERDEARRSRPVPVPVQVLADTASRIPLSAPPPTARIWLARVTEASERRVEPIAPSRPEGGPPLPEAATDTLIAAPEAPELEIDSDLEPPILRRSARLVVPDRWRARRGAPISVELDLLIEESGSVTEVEWAGGSDDSALVEAATRSALGMLFLPALRRGHPVAVWSRHRFDFGAR